MPSSYRYQKQYTQSDIEGYAIADVVLGSITLVAAAVTFWLGLRLKQNKTGLQSWVPWLKAAVVGFTLFILLHLASATVNLAAYEIDVHSYLANRLQMLQVQNYLAAASSFIRHLTEIGILLALFQLGSSLRSEKGGTLQKTHKTMGIFAFGSSILMALIAAAAFALSCSVLSWLDHEAHPHTVDVQSLTYYRISFTYIVMIFAFAFGIVVYATVIGVSVRFGSGNKGLWMLVTSCVLFFISTMYNLISYCVYMDPSGRPLKTPELYLKVLDYVFGVWPLYGILLLLSVMGKKVLYRFGSEESQFAKENHHY